MLLNINVLTFKLINIDVDEKKLLIKSYNDLITNIKIKTKNNINIRRTVRNQKRIIIFFQINNKNVYRIAYFNIFIK